MLNTIWSISITPFKAQGELRRRRMWKNGKAGEWKEVLQKYYVVDMTCLLHK